MAKRFWGRLAVSLAQLRRPTPLNDPISNGNHYTDAERARTSPRARALWAKRKREIRAFD